MFNRSVQSLWAVIESVKVSGRIKVCLAAIWLHVVPCQVWIGSFTVSETATPMRIFASDRSFGTMTDLSCDLDHKKMFIWRRNPGVRPSYPYKCAGAKKCVLKIDRTRVWDRTQVYHMCHSDQYTTSREFWALVCLFDHFRKSPYHPLSQMHPNLLIFFISSLRLACLEAVTLAMVSLII